MECTLRWKRRRQDSPCSPHLVMADKSPRTYNAGSCRLVGKIADNR